MNKRCGLGCLGGLLERGEDLLRLLKNEHDLEIRWEWSGVPKSLEYR